MTRQPVLSIALGLAAIALLAADKPAGNSRKTVQRELEKFNDLIGGWRGVGQPKRGSARGAWSERAEWTWEFKKGSVGIRYQTKGGKLVTSALLGYDRKTRRYTLDATFADKTRRQYAGKFDSSGWLVLESNKDAADHVYRMTIRRLNPKRTLVLHERRRAKSTFYTRVAGIGYTRAGTRLAASDVSGPVCIVSGGTGTSRVTYKGKSYWVCCSGCRDAFNDDPEYFLAEARDRAKKKKAAGKSR